MMEQRHLKVAGDDQTKSGPCVHEWWLHYGAVILIKWNFHSKLKNKTCLITFVLILVCF